MTKIISEFVQSPAQAVQIIHTLRDFADEHEKKILMPEIRTIVKSITTSSIDALVPATNQMLEGYMREYGAFNSAINAVLQGDVRPAS